MPGTPLGAKISARNKADPISCSILSSGEMKNEF